MGLFTSFMIDGGFREDQMRIYSPGTLYEITAGLGVTLKPIEMRSRVETLLGGWAADAESFVEAGEKVPTYALELHGINDKASSNNGYGTYLFIPDAKNSTSLPGIQSAYSAPKELYDDEDPVKILSATYADDKGYSKPGGPVVYEMKLLNKDYYPIRYWEKTDGSDPLDEIFGVFESLKPGEYAGLSLVLVPPSREWFKAGRSRIREIEDPEYVSDVSQLGLIDMFRKIMSDEDLPGEGVDRMVYKKQQTDDAEKAEIAAIKKKGEASIDHFKCTLRIYGSSDEITRTIAGIITQKTGGKYNRIDIATRNGNLLDLATRKEGEHRFVLSTQEIPMIWHVVSDGGNGNSARIHKSMPNAMIPPDELITVPIGAPGDIQKLIYSIGEVQAPAPEDEEEIYEDGYDDYDIDDNDSNTNETQQEDNEISEQDEIEAVNALFDKRFGNQNESNIVHRQQNAVNHARKSRNKRRLF